MVADAVEGGLPGLRVTAGAQGADALDLFALEGFVDVLRGDGRIVFAGEAVDADNGGFAGVDGTLDFVGGVLDFLLHPAALDGGQHSAEFFNLVKIGLNLLLDLVGQRLDRERASDGVDGVGDAGFRGDDLLGAEGDACGFFRGKGEGFVVAVGVEGLRSAQDGGHGLEGGADDVVLRLLGSERGTRGLGVETEHPGARILRAEAIAHDAGPDAAGGAKLGDLFEKIVMRVEEEGEARGEAVDVEARVDGSLDVGDAVGQCEGDFLRGGRSRFAHVVAGDGDGVPLGQVLAGPGEDVGDDAHGVANGINIGAARNVLLKDVVLDGAGEFADIGAGAAGDGHVERKQNAGRGVDGHRGGNAVERDVGEETLHIFDGVDGDADFADFADGHGRVGVVADLRGQVEGDGKAGGSLVEEEFVTAVALFCIAHAGVLAHGPEASAVHGGLDAAGEGKFAGKGEVAARGKGGEVVGGVEGFRVEMVWHQNRPL